MQLLNIFVTCVSSLKTSAIKIASTICKTPRFSRIKYTRANWRQKFISFWLQLISNGTKIAIFLFSICLYCNLSLYISMLIRIERELSQFARAVYRTSSSTIEIWKLFLFSLFAIISSPSNLSIKKNNNKIVMPVVASNENISRLKLCWETHI